MSAKNRPFTRSTLRRLGTSPALGTVHASRRPGWAAVVLVGVCCAAAVAAAADRLPTELQAVRDGASTALMLGAENVFHRTSNVVLDERLIAVPNTPVRLAVWSELRPDGAVEAWYGISRDGRTMATVRSTSYELKVRHADFDPAGPIPLVEAGLEADEATHVYIVQFVTQPLPEFRTAIAALGGTVERFMANHAYIVRMGPSVREEVAGLPFVRWVGPYHPAYRMEDVLRENRAQLSELVPLQRYNIQVFEAGNMQKAAVAARIEALGGKVDKADAGKYLLEATLTPEQLEEVIRWDEVLYVDRWGPMEPDMDIVRSIGGANYIETFGYDGTGVRGEVFDAGFNTSHPDFQYHPFLIHGGAVGVDSHGTATAGVCFGSGFGDAKARGLMPEGQGIVADYNNIDLYGTTRYNHTGELLQAPYYAVFQTSSVGSPQVTDYSNISADIDTMLFDWDILHCQSQSNMGTRASRPQAWAKNILSGGAIKHYDTETRDDDCWCSGASIGPAEDGRIKPDLCFFYDLTYTTYSTGSGYGEFGGTSGATPSIAGHCGLFLEMWADGIFGNEVLAPGSGPTGYDVFDNRPHMTTTKAVMINTANPYEFSGTSADLTRVHQGWGMPDLARLYNMRDKISVIDETEILQNMESVEFSAFVEEGEPLLKVTMIFADPAGLPSSSQARINDLSLKVTSPSGTLYWGNNGLLADNVSDPGGSANTVDTVENVFVPEPEAGLWIVEVIASEINEDGHVETPELDADFALVVSGGLLSNCSSEGRIMLDRTVYGCMSDVLVRVVDCDLNTDDGVVETVAVTIASDSEPGGETVVLTETAPETADFRGVIGLDVDDAPGVLAVSATDVIVATYIDADDGAGHTDVEVTAAATLDCVGPVISNVQVVSVGSETATITFNTSEAATGTVRYGLACGVLTESATAAGTRTAHTIQLSGLDFSTHYYFAVDATDAQGNLTTDDNGGACYSFSTPNVVYNFPMNTNPGWTTAGQWAFGQPTGGGSYNHDPTSGHTGNNVYGYNLSGDYSDNLAATYLTTTALDCVGLTNVQLSFWRWLGVESNSDFDEATIEVSNNGSSWTVIYRATDTGAAVSDSAWVHQEFDISAIADNESTVYIRWGMGPTDGGVTYPGWNIDDVQIIATGGLLAIGMPEGVPTLVPAGEATAFTVRIVSGDETYIPGSGMLHYRYDGGAFEAVALESVGGEYYQAVLPPADCDATPEFYLSAEGDQSGVIYQPTTAPGTVFTAAVGEFVVVFADDFETSTGWSVVDSVGLADGTWGRGVPVDCNRGDPPADFDGSGQCYLTDNSAASECNSDVDDGYTWLISPVLDLSSGDAQVTYALWYSNDYGGDPNNDYFVVWVSNNGGSDWVEVERFGPAASGGWGVHAFQVSDFVVPTANVKVRFEASDLNGGSVVEAGIDAFTVERFQCVSPIGACCLGGGSCSEISMTACGEAGGVYQGKGTGCDPNPCGPVLCAGDVNCDGVVDYNDIDPFVAALSCVGGEPSCWPPAGVPSDCPWLNADCNADGDVTYGDIDPFVGRIGVTCP